MATESIDIGKREVKFKGIFVLNELIVLLYRWLSSKRFVKSEEEFNEKYLIIEELPNGSRNISFSWDFENKDGLVVKKLSFTFNCVALSTAKASKNGVEFDVDNGEITVSLSASMDIDPDEQFKKSFIMSQFYKYIWKPLNGKYIKMMKDDFTKDFDKVYDAVLNFFEIKTGKADTWVRPRGMNSE